MTRRELAEQNAQLVELLTMIRDLIDQQLEEIEDDQGEDPDEDEPDEDEVVGDDDEE